jgi:Protein of unknown function (DUF2948)
MTDARFEDGAEAPLYLTAGDSDDLAVISALVQDAVFPASEVKYLAKRRQFALLVNRFRWEDRDAATREGRRFERVQSVLSFADVRRVTSQGVPQGDADMVLSLLSLAFEPGPDGTGRVMMVLAGDGIVALEVECLDATLRDVTRPYLAPSGKVPDHRP